MLNARESASGKSTDVPIGVLRQVQVEQKYRYVVALKPTLADSAAFRAGLERDHAWAMKHAGQHQLQYELGGDGTLLLEPGNYQTLAQLLDANPAIVATQGFVEQLVAQLMDYCSRLHGEGVCQLCFAPQNIFLRKGGNTPMLLTHGSFYEAVSDVKTLYEGCLPFVAPEVSEGAKATEASDVYSLGRLIEHLYSLGGMSIEYKMLLKKATALAPADRFRSVEEMRASLAQKRNMRRSLITVAAAVAISLLCVWLYIDLMPQRSDMEFIEPEKKENGADPFDETFSPDVQMIYDGDTINITEEDMQMYTQKAEQIFRRRFDEAAEEKLGRIFGNANMGANEKAIMADSKTMNQELEQLQQTLAEDMGISSERAAEIAKDVIEQKMAKKKAELENARKESERQE